MLTVHIVKGVHCFFTPTAQKKKHSTVLLINRNEVLKLRHLPNVFKLYALSKRNLFYRKNVFCSEITTIINNT